MQNSTDRPRSSVRHHTISSEDEGQRLDNWLLRVAKGVPKSHVYKVVRSGQVRINGGRVKVSTRLKLGDVVRVPPMQMVERSAVRVPDKLCQSLMQAVVLEAEDYFVVNKPAGVAVHAGSGLAFGAVDALRQGFNNPSIELVHRLDRATSGALLVAKNRKVARALQDQFRERSVGKQYLALVHGQWPTSVTTVDAPLSSNKEHAGERRVTVDLVNGKPSLSRFAVLERFGNVSLLQVTLETGRTHQIRVHAASQGCAVVGDERYGNNQDNARLRRLGLRRMFLHSQQLNFEWAGETIECIAPVGSDWDQAIKHLKSKSS